MQSNAGMALAVNTGFYNKEGLRRGKKQLQYQQD
jgi:hypothetical protein